MLQGAVLVGTPSPQLPRVCPAGMRGAQRRGPPRRGQVTVQKCQGLTHGTWLLLAQAFLVENEKGVIDFVGNRTECALLVMIQKWGEDYRAARELYHDKVAEVYGFSSERKMASVLVKNAACYRLHVKVRPALRGAAVANCGWVLAARRCLPHRASLVVCQGTLVAVFGHARAHLSTAFSEAPPKLVGRLE